MATSNRNPRSDRPDPPAAPFAVWTTLLLQPFLDAQRLQWQAYLGWQQSLATFGKDAWEQWAVHYAGGVPIDS